MARSIETEIEINGTATQVWEVLTDFGRYPEWNPFILRIAGTLQTGSRLKAVVQTPHFPKITIRPVLLKVDVGNELRWLGHWVIPKVFDGEHLFVLEPLGESKVNFLQKELFTGLLVPLLWRKMAGNIRLGFENMNQALKKRIETQSPIQPGNPAGQSASTRDRVYPSARSGGFKEGASRLLEYGLAQCFLWRLPGAPTHSLGPNSGNNRHLSGVAPVENRKYILFRLELQRYPYLRISLFR